MGNFVNIKDKINLKDKCIFFFTKVTPTPTPTPTSTPLIGSLPAGETAVQRDPFFSLQKREACPLTNERQFWAQWEDNGGSCINRMLFIHLETLRYTLSVYHTNKIVPSIGGSVIDTVEVVYNGQSTIYDSTSSLNTLLSGDISIELVSSSFEGLDFLQMRFGWIRDINDVVTLGGGVGVVMKKVISESGYWESATGPDVNGFGTAGTFLNITRSDLESAAISGENTPQWNKVMFPGTDFNALNTTVVCRPVMNRPWDPVPPAFFPLPEPVCPGIPSGNNVFQISKSEHDAYENGGTWTLNSSFSESESTADGRTSSGGGSINASGSTSGCSGSVSGSGTANVDYGSFTADYTISCDISYQLGEQNGVYYIALFANAHEASSEVESSPCGYPGNVSLVVDGHSLSGVGLWCPGWDGAEGYQNTSSSTLTATFTPSN